jgi:hypothetical protein
MEPKIQLTLVRAPDDPPVKDPEYQKQLAEFYKALQDAGIEASPRLYFRDSAPDGVAGFQTMAYLGEFGIPLAKIGVPALAGAVGAWLEHALSARDERVVLFKRPRQGDQGADTRGSDVVARGST